MRAVYWIVVAAAFRYSSLASLVTAAITPLLFIVLHQSTPARLGQVAHRLALRSPRDVLLVIGSASAGSEGSVYQRVLIATDGSARMLTDGATISS